jgi:hypothetical protein
VKKISKPTVASRKRSQPRRRQQRTRLAHEDALVAFADLAKRLHIRWYVFGAQAVNVHGFPRATADLDLTIDIGDGPTPAFMRALDAAGFTPRFADADFIAATRVLPVVHRASALPIDLVLAGPGLEQLFLDELHIETIGRRKIPFLSAENLIVTKLLAGRPKDLEDVRELVARRAAALDHKHIERLLSQLEAALDQNDLRTLYRKLRSQAR